LTCSEKSVEFASRLRASRFKGAGIERRLFGKTLKGLEILI